MTISTPWVELLHAREQRDISRRATYPETSSSAYPVSEHAESLKNDNRYRREVERTGDNERTRTGQVLPEPGRTYSPPVTQIALHTPHKEHNSQQNETTIVTVPTTAPRKMAKNLRRLRDLLILAMDPDCSQFQTRRSKSAAKTSRKRTSTNTKESIEPAAVLEDLTIKKCVGIVGLCKKVVATTKANEM